MTCNLQSATCLCFWYGVHCKAAGDMRYEDSSHSKYIFKTSLKKKKTPLNLNSKFKFNGGSTAWDSRASRSEPIYLFFTRLFLLGYFRDCLPCCIPIFPFGGVCDGFLCHAPDETGPQTLRQSIRYYVFSYNFSWRPSFRFFFSGDTKE